MSEFIDFAVAFIITIKTLRYLLIDKIFVKRPRQGISKNDDGEKGAQAGCDPYFLHEEIGAGELVTFQPVTNENDIAETLEEE